MSPMAPLCRCQRLRPLRGGRPSQTRQLQARPLQARMSDFASSDAHTHPDHNAANRALMSSFFYQSPSIAPRRKSHHKDLKRMLETPPRHAFDNTNLPILA